MSASEDTPMSADVITHEPSPSVTLVSAKKAQRVLACTMCQQRKVRCDRKFPCSNCIKVGARDKCSSASLQPRRRRRRFPERDLLDRVRRYENLLRQNHIEFEALHPSTTEHPITGEEDGDSESPEDAELDERSHRENTSGGPRVAYEAKDAWVILDAVARESRPFGQHENVKDNNAAAATPNDAYENIVKATLDKNHPFANNILFGSSDTHIDLSTLHPRHVQIFKLWRVYTENVDPLLKVTCTPNLNARIVDVIDDLANIQPELQALMFSIYSISVASLDDNECRALLGRPKEAALSEYRYACQHALLGCNLLCTADRDCLTALYLYLISSKPCTDPRALSPLLGITIRIAQRMGIHDESINAKCTPYEAEMRRRLWWSLALYDNRIGEVSGNKATMLAPDWNCRTPVNVSDFDLRTDMKSRPVSQQSPTEALFAVVRSELGDFLRHSAFHIGFANPSLKAILKEPPCIELATLEKRLEDRYFKTCAAENPLHFMTVWTTRSIIAKSHLLEHRSSDSKNSKKQTAADRDVVISHALQMLDCDTKLLTSPLTKRYRWFVQDYFPFPAYLNLVQELRERPVGKQVAVIWEAVNDNFEVRVGSSEQSNEIIKGMLSKIILHAWEAREAMAKSSDEPLQPPRIIPQIRQIMAAKGGHHTEQADEVESSTFGMPTNVEMPHLFAGGTVHGAGVAPYIPELGHPTMPYYPAQTIMDFEMIQPDWGSSGWDWMSSYL